MVTVLSFPLRNYSPHCFAALAQADLLLFSKSIMEVLQKTVAEPIDLAPCSVCGRSFNPEVLVSVSKGMRLQKHSTVAA